ncbi:hypothetical protein FIU87_10600 [Bacillus sp. THAF10]|uniref:DUF4350 domain-containing protein n=1 Tax=Bacillus sp. THAF10 TaxID=2587848 RepID=UPI0012A8E2A6|nr:DUF4350 domain-containing protein [Bacillus sp. THAF10]QFT89096.1 hypothetical protein FIU87_10600 [Bacillus sp. THAF10]
MQPLQKTKKNLVVIGALLLIFFIGYYFSQPERTQEYASFDSESPSPTGLKAFYTYLKEENVPVSRWKQSPDLLPSGDERKLLLLVEPFFIPDSDMMKDYLAFIEKGNTIVLLKSNPKGFFDIQTDFVDPYAADGVVENKLGKNYFAELETNIRLEGNVKYETLLSDSLGDIAIKRSIGTGTLIVATAPKWLTNQNILSLDHLSLILSLLNEDGVTYSAILLDEYNHGNSESSMLTIYPNWFLFLLVQGALAVILILWMHGKRFGPVLIAREEMVRYNDESIRSLAAWHLRGKTYRESLCAQADFLKYLLQEKWGIPYSKEWKDMTATLQQKWKRKNSNQIETFTKTLSSVLQNEKMTKQEYLLWSQELDSLRKEVEEE